MMEEQPQMVFDEFFEDFFFREAELVRRARRDARV